VLGEGIREHDLCCNPFDIEDLQIIFKFDKVALQWVTLRRLTTDVLSPYITLRLVASIRSIISHQ
jgi:hypothetical protein